MVKQTKYKDCSQFEIFIFQNDTLRHTMQSHVIHQ